MTRLTDKELQERITRLRIGQTVATLNSPDLLCSYEELQILREVAKAAEVYLASVNGREDLENALEDWENLGG